MKKMDRIKYRYFSKTSNLACQHPSLIQSQSFRELHRLWEEKIYSQGAFGCAEVECLETGTGTRE